MSAIVAAVTPSEGVPAISPGPAQVEPALHAAEGQQHRGDLHRRLDGEEHKRDQEQLEIEP